MIVCPTKAIAPSSIIEEVFNTEDFTLYAGLEVDFFFENIDGVIAELSQYPLDYLIGSVHFSGTFPIDHSEEYWKPLTLDQIDDYMSPWNFTSDDGRFEMLFIPIMDRASKTDVKLICSDQHQVFGKFSGRAVLDDGTIIEVQDFLGFAEKVYNKW